MSIVTRTGKGSALTWAEADSNFTSLVEKARVATNVKDYGAVGDGTTDDTAAIQTVITAAIALNTSVAIFFPAGTYVVNSTLTCDPTTQASSKVVLYGEGPSASVIQAKAGFSASKLLHFGASGTTTRMQGSGLSKLGFNGNNLPASGGVAGVYVFNAYRCVFSDLAVDSFGTGDGFASAGHTSGVAGDPCNQSNVFHNIYVRNSGKAGYYFRGEKSSMFDLLQADGNAEQGFFFDSETVGGTTETTECVIGSLLSKNNTGAGFAFSGLSKYSVANLEAYINGGPGVNFVATRSGTTVSSNACSFGSIVSRNNLGAVITDTGANIYLSSSDIGSIVHIGGKGLGTSPVESEAIKIAGWYAITIGRINSVLNIGTVLRIVDQTGSQYSNTISVGVVIAYSNGHAVATANHGVSLEGNTSLVSIDKLHSQNTYTTAAESSFELKTEAFVKARIDNLYAYAAEAGQEVSIGNQSFVSLDGTSNIRGIQADRKTTGLVAAADITAYGTYSNEFWDNSTAVRKYVRMGDSTLRLLSGEVGTFTPAITFATPGNLSVSYSNQIGRYEVRGSKCFVEILLSTSAFTHTTASGGLRITGLPFAAAASSNDGSALTGFGGITKANFTQFGILTQNNQTYCVVYASGSGQAFTAVTYSDVPTGGTVFLKVAFDYEVDLPLT